MGGASWEKKRKLVYGLFGIAIDFKGKFKRRVITSNLYFAFPAVKKDVCDVTVTFDLMYLIIKKKWRVTGPPKMSSHFLSFHKYN